MSACDVLISVCATCKAVGLACLACLSNALLILHHSCEHCSCTLQHDGDVDRNRDVKHSDKGPLAKLMPTWATTVVVTYILPCKCSMS